MLRQTPREGRYSRDPVHTFLSVFGSYTFSQLFSLFLGMFVFSCKSCLSFSSNSILKSSLEIELIIIFFRKFPCELGKSCDLEQKNGAIRK